jgi:arylsulfatase A-like enzyme
MPSGLFSPDVRARLAQADKLPYDPRPREFVRGAPQRALMVIVDGVTPEAFARANTPTFDRLAQHGVSANDARTIFPTITGPAHTSILTGARVGAHGFLYPKMLDAYGNRLFDFTEGLMQAETIAEAWRPRGMTSAGIGSRFLRGADMMVTEGVFGQDYEEITRDAISAVKAWAPHFLLVVYYVADTFGHLFGPEAAETLAAIELVDGLVSRILDAYARNNLLDETTVAVLADHGMMPVQEIAEIDFVTALGALPHGRMAFLSRPLDPAEMRALLNDPRVETIYSRAELELLGAWNPRWGEHVIHLKEGLMFFDERNLRGYHGAWTEIERRVPLLLSGAGIRAGRRLDTCETIDLAPTLSLLLGGDVPQNAEGRVLWEVLDTEVAQETTSYSRILLERDELLQAIKVLKREFAEDGISPEEYLARETQWRRRGEELRGALQAEARRLREIPN